MLQEVVSPNGDHSTHRHPFLCLKRMNMMIKSEDDYTVYSRWVTVAAAAAVKERVSRWLGHGCCME